MKRLLMTAALCILAGLFLAPMNIHATSGTVCKVTLSYHRWGMDINNTPVHEGDNVYVQAGSNLICPSITRCSGGTAPFNLCFICEYSSYEHCCAGITGLYCPFCWQVSFPAGCFLCQASVDDSGPHFHICGERWFNVLKPAKAEVVPKGCVYTITWDPSTHVSGTCSTVSIWLCQEDGTDDDLTIPVVHQIASQVPNNGSYAWQVDPGEVEDNSYRIMVVCGSATGYSNVFAIGPTTCLPDLTANIDSLWYVETNGTPGKIEPTDRFTVWAKLRIENIGLGLAPAPCFTVSRKLWAGCTSSDGAAPKGHDCLGDLEPGQGGVLYGPIDTNVPRGVYEYWLIVDPDNLIPESDESNNSNSSCGEVVRAKDTTWGAIKSIYR